MTVSQYGLIQQLVQTVNDFRREMNERIDGLRDEMHQTYDRLQNLDSEANRGLSAIQTELGGLITDVGALCGEVSALNERVKALEDAVWRDGAESRSDW
jgi:predicted  nucleic acid-binding Zn-ribbon protein